MSQWVRHARPDERLTDDQLKLVFDKAREVGVDISTTTDGKGIKALNFGTENFASKLSEIQKAASIDQSYETVVDSELYETEKIFKGRDNLRSLPVWLNTVAGGQSLLQRSVDSLLVEYAKAAAAQGYIFDPALYAKRYGLSEADAQYVTDKLYPTDPLARSASPLLAGTEILPVKSTYTLAGKRKTDMAQIYDTRSYFQPLAALLNSSSHQERTGRPVLPTGDGEILRWLKGECLSMSSGEKSAEQKSLRAFTAAS